MDFCISKNVLVIGAGCSGMSAARLAASRQCRVTLLDEKTPRNLESLQEECRERGITLITGFSLPAFPEHYDIIILSPGIAGNSRLGQMALSSGSELFSELGFAARLCPWPKVGITGTNGKTTTVELLTHCLNTAGIKAVAGGNIGLPLSQIILDRPDLDWVVLEISTFQMEFTPEDFRTDAAALLNITPDHLNRHGTYEIYSSLKKAVLASCPAGKGVCNENLTGRLPDFQGLGTFSAADDSRADFQVREQQLGRQRNGVFTPVISTEDLPFTGRHNLENTLAVLAVGEKMGIAPERFVPGIRTFRTGPHRIQRIAEYGGVTYIDDSKATNVDAVIQAIESMPEARGRIHLIAGGVDKGCDLKELIPYLQNSIKQVYLIGACRQRLKTAWNGIVPLRDFDSLEAAVTAAGKAAVQGDTVLLSPACASQDMFKDYIERGQIFADTVKKIFSGSNTI